MRLLRYIPVIVPFVVRYLRSPKGKAALNRVLNKRNGGNGSARRR